jgi:hypothetical protein
MPGGEHLTGFTRIMHKTRDDELMDEVSKGQCSLLAAPHGLCGQTPWTLCSIFGLKVQPVSMKIMATPHMPLLPFCCAQIPTFRAQPLHPECDTYCDFPVADRANAVQQWWVAARVSDDVPTARPMSCQLGLPHAFKSYAHAHTHSGAGLMQCGRSPHCSRVPGSCWWSVTTCS